MKGDVTQWYSPWRVGAGLWVHPFHCGGVGEGWGLGKEGVTGAGSMHIGQMSNDTYKHSVFHTKVLSFSRSVSSLVGT